MPTLNIDGLPKPVTVDASFGALSPEQQDAEVNRIRTEILGKLGTADGRDRSIGGAIKFGVGQAVDGIENTVRVVTGDTSVRPERAPDGNYDPAAPQMVQAYRDGRYTDMLGYAPRAIVEQTPDMLALAGTAAAGSLVGGPLGGLAAGATYAGARNYGDNVEGRARNDNRTQIEGADYVVGGVTTAASAGLDLVGLKGGGRLLSGATSLPGRVVQNQTREALTEGAQSVVEQSGQTAGTERGLDIDGAQVVVSGVLGAGSRGVMDGGGAALSGARFVAGAPRRAIEATAERELGGLTTERARSVVRVNELLDTYREMRSESGGRAPDEDVLNSARGDLTVRVNATIDDARRSGWIDSEQVPEIKELFRQVRQHNTARIDGTDTEIGPLGLAQIDALNAPAVFKASLRDLFSDLDTLSFASRKKNLNGPLEWLGRAAGTAAGVVGGGMTAGPLGMIAAAGTATLGSPALAMAGGKIGRMGDRALGLGTPLVRLARGRAEAVLAKAGVEAGNTLGNLKTVRDLITTEGLGTRAAMGLRTDVESVSAAKARTLLKRVNAGLEVSETEVRALRPAAQRMMLKALQDANIREQGEARIAEGVDADLLRQRSADDAATKARQIDAAYAGRDGGRPVDPAVAQARLDVEMTRKREREEAAAWAGQTAAERTGQRQLGRQTDAEIAAFEAAVADARRAVKARTKKLEQEGAAQDRADGQAEAGVDKAQQARDLVRQRQIEQAYGQRDKQNAAPDPYEQAQQQVEARKAAEMAEMEKQFRQQQAEAPAPAPQPQAPAQPQPAPQQAAPQPQAQPSQPGARAPVRGWQRGLMKLASDEYGQAVSADAIDAALNRIEIDPSSPYDADVIDAARQQDRIPRTLLQHITAEVLKDNGIDMRNPYAGRANGGDNPIRNHGQFEQAAASYQRAVERAIDKADAAGDYAMVELATLFGTRTKSQLPYNVRQLRVEALIESSPDAVTKARRSAYLRALTRIDDQDQ